MDSEEEDTAVLGGEGFTPEQLAQAEQHFSAQLVSHYAALLHARQSMQKHFSSASVVPSRTEVYPVKSHLLKVDSLCSSLNLLQICLTVFTTSFSA